MLLHTYGDENQIHVWVIGEILGIAVGCDWVMGGEVVEIDRGLGGGSGRVGYSGYGEVRRGEEVGEVGFNGPKAGYHHRISATAET